jgi:hypothetical protein
LSGGELPLRAKPLEELDPQLYSIKIAAIAEQIDFQTAGMVAESGIRADIRQGGINAALDKDAGDKNAGWQELVLGPEIRRRKAQPAAALVPADDAAPHLVGSAEKTPNELDIVVDEGFPDQAGTDRPARLRDRRNDPDQDLQAPSQPSKVGGRSPPVFSKPEAAAHDDRPDVHPSREDRTDEFLGGERGQPGSQGYEEQIGKAKPGDLTVFLLPRLEKGDPRPP